MSAPTFSEAVDIAKQFISENRFEGGHDLAGPGGLERYISERVGRALTNAFRGGFDGYDSGENPDRNISYLLREAKNDPECFDALRRGLAIKIEAGKDLHPDLRVWAAKFLRSEVKCPKKSAGRGSAMGLHNLIGKAVDLLAEEGMFATRNDEASVKASACDAVSQALAELRLGSQGFGVVKKIYEKWKRERIIIEYDD